VRVSLEKKGDVAVMKLRGAFFGDGETKELENSLRQLQTSDNKKLIIDLGAVSRINSISMGMLVAAHTNYVKRGGRIILVNLEKQLEDLFTITKLTLLFEIATSYEQALAELIA